MCRIILFSSALVVVTKRGDTQFYRLFGLQPCEKYGRKGTTGYSNFKDKECQFVQVVDKIKSFTFRWLKAKYATLPFNFHGWWLSPFTILGID